MDQISLSLAEFSFFSLASVRLVLINGTMMDIMAGDDEGSRKDDERTMEKSYQFLIFYFSFDFFSIQFVFRVFKLLSSSNLHRKVRGKVCALRATLIRQSKHSRRKSKKKVA